MKTYSNHLEPSASVLVSVRQFAQIGAELLRSVRQEQATVAVSRHGRLIAVFLPASAVELMGLLSSGVESVSTRTLERDGISGSLKGIDDGASFVVTWHNRPFASLVPASSWHALWARFDDVDAPTGAPTAPSRKAARGKAASTSTVSARGRQR